MYCSLVDLLIDWLYSISRSRHLNNGEVVCLSFEVFPLTRRSCGLSGIALDLVIAEGT